MVMPIVNVVVVPRAFTAMLPMIWSGDADAYRRKSDEVVHMALKRISGLLPYLSESNPIGILNTKRTTEPTDAMRPT